MTGKRKNDIDTQKVLEAAKTAANKALLRLGLKVERKAKQLMKTGGKKKVVTQEVVGHTKKGKPKIRKVTTIIEIPSTPPDPPHVQTGNLRSSVTTAMDKSTVLVGAIAKYGKVHEYGGKHKVKSYVRMCKKWPNGMPRTKPIPVTVRAHTRTYPKRPFIHPALEKVKADLKAEFEGAMHK